MLIKFDRRSNLFLIVLGVCLILTTTYGQDFGTDKTLVSWVSLDNLDQRGGSALTIDNSGGEFDAIVFGEIEPFRWMAGSNHFRRTQKDQVHNVPENSKPGECVQIAIVYKGDQISIFRNGLLYASYMVDNQLKFDTVSCSVMFGRRHLDAMDTGNSFTGKIREARIYMKALSPEMIRQLTPGEVREGPRPWAWWQFEKHGLQDITRKFVSFRLTGSAFLESGELVLAGNGASFITSRSEHETYWKKTQRVTQDIVRNTRTYREKLLEDPYRPAFHFCVPEGQGYPGDPNGAFYHNGRYHLMYLYNRSGSGFSWGHVSSTDLLHWRHHPDALGPGDGDEGCFSGGAFVDDDGSAVLSYWMIWGDKGIGLARNKDSDFNEWQKFENNPVIRSTEWGLTQTNDNAGNIMYIGSADPSNIWKNRGKYYMLTGNLLVLNKIGRDANAPENEKGDRLYLFESEDLQQWKYLHRFYESNRKWTEASEDNMCPSFLPLPSSPDGGLPSDKYLLLFISHNLGCQYYIGDYRDHYFYPVEHGRMTWTDNTYFAPEALLDEYGRQIMWSWIFDDRPDEMKLEYGWTGTYGLPRSLWINEQGKLGIRPVKELQNLRLDEKKLLDLEITEEEIVLDSLGEELMELEINIDTRDAGMVGVAVAVSDDSTEKTLIEFDRDHNQLLINTNASGLNFGRKTIEKAPLYLDEGEYLKLRIFLDRSILEVFANDRQAIARRIYPSLGGRGIRIYTQGGSALVKSLKRWKMAPSNPY